MNKKWIAGMAWVAMTTALSMAALQLPPVPAIAQAIAQAQPTRTPLQLPITPDAQHHIDLSTAQPDLPDALTQAVAEVMRVSNPFGHAAFAVTAVQWASEGNWALISVAALDGPTVVQGYIGSQGSGRLLLAFRQNGAWQVALEGGPAFASLVDRAPDALLSAAARSLLAPKQTPASAGPSAVQTVSYKWPWPAGLSWRWLQGWHARALDIGTDGTDRRVLASADGVVTYVCQGNLGAALKVRDADGVVLEYWHIDSGLLSGAVHLGATVVQGQWLGTLRPGTWTDSSACGTQYTYQSANSSHVHWVLPTDRTFNVEGWTITSPTSTFSNGGQNRTCNGGCWSSFIFFASSNQPSDEPSPATPTPTDTATATATPTETAAPTATATPVVTASMSLEPAWLITQTGTQVTLHALLNVTGPLEPLDTAEVTFTLSYNPALVSIAGISATNALTHLVISNTLHGATLAGRFNAPVSLNSPVPIAEVTLSTTAAGLGSVQFTSALLEGLTGDPLVPVLRDSQIFAVTQWPPPQIYLPLVARDTADEIVPSATPTVTPTPTVLAPTPTAAATATATATNTPTPTESSTATSTATSTPTSSPSTPTPTLLPTETQTPTPTSTVLSAS